MRRGSAVPRRRPPASIRRWLPLASFAGLSWLAACGEAAPGSDTGDAERGDAGTAATVSTGSVAGGGAPATAFRDSMRAHLDSVVRLEPDRLVFVRAAHDSLARHALERMDREMEAMNMPPDEAWRALEDSVRRDLDVLRALVGEAFVLGMRGHAGRMRRLLQMHERMMTAP